MFYPHAFQLGYTAPRIVPNPDVETIDISAEPITTAMQFASSDSTDVIEGQSGEMGTNVDGTTIPVVVTETDTDMKPESSLDPPASNDGVDSPMPGTPKADLAADTEPPKELPEVVSAPMDTTEPTDSAETLYQSCLISLDQAISNSLCTLSTEERVRRISSNLIIAGGGALIPSISPVIEARVLPLLLAKFPDLDKITVIPPPRETDPRVVAWKGASAVARLTNIVDELWLTRDDWRMLGLRGLRDKCVFMQ